MTQRLACSLADEEPVGLATACLPDVRLRAERPDQALELAGDLRPEAAEPRVPWQHGLDPRRQAERLHVLLRLGETDEFGQPLVARPRRLPPDRETPHADRDEQREREAGQRQTGAAVEHAQRSRASNRGLSAGGALADLSLRRDGAGAPRRRRSGDRLQRQGEIVRGGEAVCGALLEAAENEGMEARRHPLRQRRRLLLEDRRHHVGVGLSREWTLP